MVWQKNVELLHHADLQDRSGFKLAIQEVDGHFFLYVASLWQSGWSILDVTDPVHPQYLRWIDGPPNTWTIQVQVAEGKMITGLETIPPGWSPTQDGTPASRGFM